MRILTKLILILDNSNSIRAQPSYAWVWPFSSPISVEWMLSWAGSESAWWIITGPRTVAIQLGLSSLLNPNLVLQPKQTHTKYLNTFHLFSKITLTPPIKFSNFQPRPHKFSTKPIRICILSPVYWICSFFRQCQHFILKMDKLWTGTYQNWNEEYWSSQVFFFFLKLKFRNQ